VIDNEKQRTRLNLRYTVLVLTGYGTDFVLVAVEMDLTVVSGVGTLRH